jgi:outer membrane protein
MYKIVLIVTGIMTACNMQAQDTLLRVTREEAIALALKNRNDRYASVARSNAARVAVNEARSSWLPALEVNAETRYTPQLEQSILSGGILPGFNEPALVALGGAKNLTSLNLTLEQPLFDKTRSAQVALAKKQSELEDERERESTRKIREYVQRAYFAVLLKKLQYEIFSQIQERNSEYEQVALAKLKNGRITEIEYLRTRLERDNGELELIVIQEEYKEARRALCFQMNLPAETIIELTEQLQDVIAATTANRGGENKEVIQARLSSEERQLQLDFEKQRCWPQVNLKGSYTYFYQNENYRFGNSGWWSPYSFVGLKLSFSASNLLRSRATIGRKKLLAEESVLRYKHLQVESEQMLNMSETALKNAATNIKAAKANYDFAQTISTNQREQFKVGAFEYGQLLDTEKTMRAAEHQYINAAYKYLLANLDYQKQAGAL